MQSKGLKIAQWGGQAMMSKPYSLETRAAPKFINFFHPPIQCMVTMLAVKMMAMAMMTGIQTSLSKTSHLVIVDGLCDFKDDLP